MRLPYFFYKATTAFVLRGIEMLPQVLYRAVMLQHKIGFGIIYTVLCHTIAEFRNQSRRYALILVFVQNADKRHITGSAKPKLEWQDPNPED